MRKIKIGVNCDSFPECECDKIDFPYTKIPRRACEIFDMDYDGSGGYITRMEVLTQYIRLGHTREEYLERYGNRFFAEGDLHSFKH
ncbi:hypothetical protein [Paenibacillus polymyxa]|uniref:Uncharacterized protein n=1 Tax=Paenibacillus polymyxa TaxID=1406 RepID=A0AAP4A0M2_PAEPO|nr:hypothetical protein [Paenibacillus polymyxa]MDH2332476.1 hypothetical protein [Paenibacillus polymyxa]